MTSNFKTSKNYVSAIYKGVFGLDMNSLRALEDAWCLLYGLFSVSDLLEVITEVNDLRF